MGCPLMAADVRAVCLGGGDDSDKPSTDLTRKCCLRYVQRSCLLQVLKAVEFPPVLILFAPLPRPLASAAIAVGVFQICPLRG